MKKSDNNPQSVIGQLSQDRSFRGYVNAVGHSLALYVLVYNIITRGVSLDVLKETFKETAPTEKKDAYYYMGYVIASFFMIVIYCCMLAIILML